MDERSPKAPARLAGWLSETWWRPGARMPGIAALVVVALALLGLLALIVTTIESERVQRAQAERTAQAIDSLNSLLVATVLGETGQRGYFITLDDRYLEPYRAGRTAYRTALGRLHAQLGAHISSDQQDLLGEVERLGDAKWAELDDTVADVKRGDKDAARARILSDEGQQAMAGLRDAVARFEAVERRKLDEATARSAAAESRILPALGLLFVAIIVALALGLWQVGRVARAEAAAAGAAAIAEARDRADLLARELNHRVKNLFAVVLAIVRMTGKGDPAAEAVVERITQRIHALVTAHEVTQGAADRPEVDLADLVEKAIAPYRTGAGDCALDGDAVILPARLAMPIGLVLHELVTNAVKYGAWSQPGGSLTVRWGSDGERVTIHWREEGVEMPGEPGRTGFGSMLMQSSARQLGGTIEREFTPGGLAVTIDFPAEQAD